MGRRDGIDAGKDGGKDGERGRDGWRGRAEEWRRDVGGRGLEGGGRGRGEEGGGRTDVGREEKEEWYSY